MASPVFCLFKKSQQYYQAIAHTRVPAQRTLQLTALHSFAAHASSRPMNTTAYCTTQHSSTREFPSDEHYVLLHYTAFQHTRVPARRTLWLTALHSFPAHASFRPKNATAYCTTQLSSTREFPPDEHYVLLHYTAFQHTRVPPEERHGLLHYTSFQRTRVPARRTLQLTALHSFSAHASSSPRNTTAHCTTQLSSTREFPPEERYSLLHYTAFQHTRVSAG